MSFASRLPPWLRFEKEQEKPVKPSADEGRVRSPLKLWLPRAEIIILIIGFACTIYGKLAILQRQKSPNLLAELSRVTFPDVLFFAAVLLLISCLYMLKPSAFIARCAMVVATLISTWSVLNLAWLMESGVQLQPGILMILAGNFKELWAPVQVRLASNLTQVVALVMIALGGFIFFLWCFIRPGKHFSTRTSHARRSAVISIAIALLVLAKPNTEPNTNSSLAGEVLGFSSHWYALVSSVVKFRTEPSFPVQSPNIKYAGQHQIGNPELSPEDLPNVVLVLLESISHSVASLNNPQVQQMPQLASLANEGVEFRLTYAPVPYTTKAFWTILTSTSPIVEADHVEAIPAKQPYGGLPSILARVGYRSAFFEMSKGSFECAPGLFNNLAFDWAWFRENLEDASAYIGYMGGDDLRMLKPAFEWAKKDSRPFFLMMTTSISHDPYEVPAWFGEKKETTYENYLQTVSFTDYFLKQLCQSLSEHGLEENTILCILGDHGTSFRVKESKGRWVPYEEVIRVPWVIRWPGHIKGGQVIDWPCSQLDVTPTILNLIGFDISKAGFEGKDAFSTSEANRRLYFSSLLADSPIGWVC
jgi:glucan phosphoethanolaminetransferase (alkaline phosphatase superfamily)